LICLRESAILGVLQAVGKGLLYCNFVKR